MLGMRELVVRDLAVHCLNQSYLQQILTGVHDQPACARVTKLAGSCMDGGPRKHFFAPVWTSRKIARRGTNNRLMRKCLLDDDKFPRPP
jgi:hypothetical protein